MMDHRVPRGRFLKAVHVRNRGGASIQVALLKQRGALCYHLRGDQLAQKPVPHGEETCIPPGFDE